MGYYLAWKRNELSSYKDNLKHVTNWRRKLTKATCVWLLRNKILEKAKGWRQKKKKDQGFPGTEGQWMWKSRVQVSTTLHAPPPLRWWYIMNICWKPQSGQHWNKTCKPWSDRTCQPRCTDGSKHATVNHRVDCKQLWAVSRLEAGHIWEISVMSALLCYESKLLSKTKPKKPIKQLQIHKVRIFVVVEWLQRLHQMTLGTSMSGLRRTYIIVRCNLQATGVQCGVHMSPTESKWD